MKPIDLKKKEFWVGVLVLSVFGIVFGFAYFMGVLGPLQKQVTYYLLYNFAGGVEVGSPVRVSGVKVGKVRKIEFITQEEAQTEVDRVTLKLTVDVAPRAAAIVKADSKFYINMAGIIGERYVEVSPGSIQAKTMPHDSVIRGTDPPRIDQLISQGYGVFGKIQDYLEENQQTVTDFLKDLNYFMAQASKMLKGKDKQKFIDLIDNINTVTLDAHRLAEKLETARTQKVIDEIYELIDRAHLIDKPALKQFFQEEGIRTRLF